MDNLRTQCELYYIIAFSYKFLNAEVLGRPYIMSIAWMTGAHSVIHVLPLILSSKSLVHEFQEAH